MVRSKEKTVEEILDKLDLRQKEITENLRALIKKTPSQLPKN
jgi:predicted transcriptional regulator